MNNFVTDWENTTLTKTSQIDEWCSVWTLRIFTNFCVNICSDSMIVNEKNTLARNIMAISGAWSQCTGEIPWLSQQQIEDVLIKIPNQLTNLCTTLSRAPPSICTTGRNWACTLQTCPDRDVKKGCPNQYSISSNKLMPCQGHPPSFFALQIPIGQVQIHPDRCFHQISNTGSILSKLKDYVTIVRMNQNYQIRDFHCKIISLKYTLL